MTKIGRDVLPSHDILRFSSQKEKKVVAVDPWITEYEAEELEMIRKGLEKISDRISRSPELGAPSLTELFRILYEDKFQYKTLIAFPLTSDVSPKLLLPFYEQVVLPVSPARNKERFTSVHGLTPEEIAHLYSRNRVLPIILGDPTILTEKDASYMGVLLEKKPPILRTERWLRFYKEEKGQKHSKRGKRLSENAKAMIEAAKSDFPERTAKFLMYTAEVMDESYVSLYFCGFGDLADRIVEKYAPPLVAYLLFVLGQLLVNPTLIGLGAATQIPKEGFEWFNQIHRSFEEIPAISRDLIFPSEIGNFLTSCYDLTFPTDPSMEIVDKAYRDKALSKARRLLIEFDRAVLEGDENRAVKKGTHLEEVYREAVEALLTLDKRVEKCRWAWNSVMYGAIGLLGMLSTPPGGLLAGLGYRVAEKKVTDLVVPKLAGIGFNPLPIALWKFKKEFRSIEELKADLRKTKP